MVSGRDREMIHLKKIALFNLTLLLCFNLHAHEFPEVVTHVKTDEKVVALTFDDGPNKIYTQQVLDVLKKHNTKATFYVVGTNAKSSPELIKQIMEQGHELGNHSMNHDKMKGISVEQITQDIQAVDQILKDYGYNKEITYRAPYALTSANLRTALRNLNKRMVLFTFSPFDWKKISAQQIYNNIMKELKPGLIILLHDGGGNRANTVKATDMLITTLHEKGYKFVTVSDLITYQK